jgi:hypothetical protein
MTKQVCYWCAKIFQALEQSSQARARRYMNYRGWQ